MKVYIAADFGRVDEADALGRLIEQLDGVRVVSRWHQRPNVVESASAARIGGPMDEIIARTSALRNLEDIDASDVFIVLTSGTTARGGRHFETGYAVARRKPIVVIGPVEHAFQHLANHIIDDGTQIAEILRTRLEVECKEQ